MKEMWDRRYADSEYAYGTSPNRFFKQVLGDIPDVGKILMPAEGEGRNAVYAARKGWEVSAFDISEEGKKKAIKLANEFSVNIDYEVGELFELPLAQKQFDAAALIFAHFPPPLLHRYHQKIGALIKPGGTLVLEGFSVEHLPLQVANPEAGGPKHPDMLFTVDGIKADFSDFEFSQLEEVTIELDEGHFHKGLSKVIRAVGKKQ